MPRDTGFELTGQCLQDKDKEKGRETFSSNNLDSKKEKQQQQEDPSGPCVSAGEGMKDVPIFTEEFLALNKARETELKQLRKSVTEMEEQGGFGLCGLVSVTDINRLTQKVSDLGWMT